MSIGFSSSCTNAGKVFKITSWKQVIWKVFLAWMMWKTQYSHFRPQCIDIAENHKYTKNLSNDCLKIREVFTTTCDGIDFCQQKWGYWKISPLGSSVAFNNEIHWNFVDTGRMSCKLHNQTDIIKSNVEDFASTPYNLIKPSVSPPYVIWLMLVKIQKQFSKCIQNSRKSTTHILVILLVEFQVLNWKSCWHMLISILIRKADLFEGSHLDASVPLRAWCSLLSSLNQTRFSEVLAVPKKLGYFFLSFQEFSSSEFHTQKKISTTAGLKRWISR